MAGDAVGGDTAAGDTAMGGMAGVRRRWIPSVRARATIAAVLVFALIGGFAAAGLLVSMRDSLMSQLLESTRQRAETIAAALEYSVAPQVLVNADDDEIVQIVGASGRVLAQSDLLEGASPITTDATSVVVRLEPDAKERYRAVTAAPTSGPFAGAQVLVGASTRAIDGYVTSLAWRFALAIPLLSLVVGLLTWLVVGAALRPVEAMRRKVEEISAHTITTRLPDPGGRDEIARLAATLNGMLARLAQSQQRQRRFVSDASHELRSPLAAMRQAAEVTLTYPGSIGAAELASTTLDETLRLQRLVESMLLLSRVDEGGGGLARVPLDLEDLVLDEAARLRGSTALTIDTREVHAVRITADGAALDQVVRNLADNAARHATTTIAFAVRRRGAVAELDVDDDGSGVPEAEREHVFERFVRLDEARTRDDGGSGLGLAIVRELVEAHGGTVQMTHAPLGGARLHIELPAAHDEPA